MNNFQFVVMIFGLAIQIGGLVALGWMLLICHREAKRTIEAYDAGNLMTATNIEALLKRAAQ
ncbi:MAG TPA: hypothetical protein VMT64_05900 [Candidatus Binataceae bacterium]|nr:hypothetical protein [Candidatus Binataceae bacterium]